MMLILFLEASNMARKYPAATNKRKEDGVMCKLQMLILPSERRLSMFSSRPILTLDNKIFPPLDVEINVLAKGTCLALFHCHQ